MAENFFNVCREVWIEDRSFAGFFFVCFGQGDAFGDAAAHRLGGVKDGYRPLVIFDDDLCARSHACHQRSKVARRFRLGNVDHILSHVMIIHPSFAYVLAERLPFFLAFAHRARAAFLASSTLSWGVRAAMRAFPPLPPAAFPPFLPISRMTLEIRSRLIASSYGEWVFLATFGY